MADARRTFEVRYKLSVAAIAGHPIYQANLGISTRSLLQGPWSMHVSFWPGAFSPRLLSPGAHWDNWGVIPSNPRLLTNPLSSPTQTITRGTQNQAFPGELSGEFGPTKLPGKAEDACLGVLGYVPVGS
jgi:hypothetical protein